MAQAWDTQRYAGGVLCRCADAAHLIQDAFEETAFHKIASGGEVTAMAAGKRNTRIARFATGTSLEGLVGALAECVAG